MNIYVYDPTTSDNLSKVRGIGRYLQILKESLPKGTVFTQDLKTIPHDSVFVNPFINFIQPPLITKRVARKQIGVIHDVIPLQFPERFPIGIKGKLNVFRNRIALKNYDLIITDSETSKKNIIDKLKISASKIQVVYPTIPKAFSSQSSSNTQSPIPDTRYLIYVGDVTWNKNLVNIAKAIKLGSIPCVFVGKTFTDSVPDNGWTTEFKEFMKMAKDDKKFAFPGFISDDQLKTLYKNAVVNILVSHEEGFGFSYFEASSQKTPSILSDIDIFHETSGDAAMFVDRNKPEEIALAVKKLSVDSALRNNLGQKAFERSQSLPDSAAQWRSLLESLQTQQ